MTKKDMNHMGFTRQKYKELGKIWALLSCNSREEQDDVLAYYDDLEKNKNCEDLSELETKELEKIMDNFHINMQNVEKKK